MRNRPTKKQREAAFARLQELDRAGRLTPAIVVKEARNPKSPLHKGFTWTWDKTTAAAKWLEQQARRFIESYYVYADAIDVSPVEQGAAVAFVRDPDAAPDVARYTAANNMTGDVAQRALDAELQRIEGHVARGWALAQQWGLTSEFIARLTQIIGGMQRPEPRSMVVAA